MRGHGGERRDVADGEGEVRDEARACRACGRTLGMCAQERRWPFPISSFLLKKILFMYLFMAAQGLRCYTRAFSSRGLQGLLSGCSAWAFHCSGCS